VELVRSRDWLLIQRFLDEIKNQQQKTLETSQSLEDILRAQGAIKVYKDLEKRILPIVEDALQEQEEIENG